MKKIIFYTISILLLTIIVSGATYAYFVSTTNSNKNALNTETGSIKVTYIGGAALEGLLSLSEDKSGGINTTVHIKKSEDSLDAQANIYINIDSISEALATEGLNWEVYKKVKGTESFVKSGTFADCDPTSNVKKCSTGDKLYIVTGYELLTDDTAFTVYVWLDGNKVGNEVMGATFKGTVAAETENITTNLG